jgi:drug/metabolite transporter (DMT)-like permease
VVSLLLLVVLVRLLRSGNEPPLRKDFWRLCFMAASGVAGYQGLLYLGLRYTDAINAALMNSAGPLVAMTMAWLALGTVVRPVQWMGALLSLVGIAVILSGGSFEQLKAIQFNVGDLIMLVAVFTWSMYTVLVKRRPAGLHPQSLLAATMVLATAAAPLPGIVDTAILGHLDSVIHLSAVAAGSTVIATVIWLFGFLRMGTTATTSRAWVIVSMTSKAHRAC